MPISFNTLIANSRSCRPKALGSVTNKQTSLPVTAVTMEQAVLNFLVNTQASLPDVIAMATENPAKALGVFDRMGSLEVGKQADITIFDDNMNIKTTLVKGRAVYQ